MSGPIPKGRARHSAVIHDEKLYILGGMTGNDSYVLDDICYLDLKTWTWSRAWRFVPRYDHTSWIWNGRVWVFGGIGEDMERSSEIWWLDLRGSPAFDSPPSFGTGDRQMLTSRRTYQSFGQSPQSTAVGSSGYAANSSSVQANPNQLASRLPPIAPGSINSVKFISSPHLPAQTTGTHFHVYSSGHLLDFVTPANVIYSSETSLSALDLDALRWQKIADGKDLFNPSYRWQYCVMNEDATHVWLLGCPSENVANGTAESSGEYLSDVLPIDLRKFGLLGNRLAEESYSNFLKLPASDANKTSSLSGIGADLVKTFDQPPESGSGADFVVTGEREDMLIAENASDISNIVSEARSANHSQPIHVHKFILQARWPHFARLYASQMIEFHTKKLHIPEPYSAVRAFLHYLYTDSIAGNSPHGPSLPDVAGMLVMANIYDMPRLRLLCVNRLGRELDVPHAATIWERAATAGEDWLKQRAAAFCMLHWGRVVRTPGFRTLGRKALMELCEEVDSEGRVVGGEELEIVGGLGGGKYGFGGSTGGDKHFDGTGANGQDDGDGDDATEDEGMDVV